MTRLLGHQDPDALTNAAVDFALQRTANPYERMSDEARNRLTHHFSDAQVRQLDAIVRLITTANLTMALLAALGSRRSIRLD